MHRNHVLLCSGSAIVSYRQKLIYDEDGSVEASDVVFFDLLQVKLANGEEFSALDSYMQDESVVTHKKSESLGKKLFFPVSFSPASRMRRGYTNR